MLGDSEVEAQTRNETATSKSEPAPLPPPDFAALLAQLAALPPDQRAALAALLDPPPVAVLTPAPVRPALDDSCPLDGGKEGGTN